MNSDEKALDILMQFEEVTCPNWEEGNNEYTRKCALIAVDMILKDLNESLQVASALHPMQKD